MEAFPVLLAGIGCIVLGDYLEQRNTMSDTASFILYIVGGIIAIFGMATTIQLL